MLQPFVVEKIKSNVLVDHLYNLQKAHYKQ